MKTDKMIRPLICGVVTLALALTNAPARADDPNQLKTGQRLAFMGDSITAYGWGSPGGYVKLVVDGLGKQGIKVVPIPAGVGGNTSKDMLARLDRDVLSKHPDWMTLSCGVNDVWHGVTGVDLPTYKQNITAIVDQATAQGVKVVLMTSTPIGEEDNANNQKLAAYNDFLHELAKARHLSVAEANADMRAVLQSKGPLTSSSRFLTADGVHMNTEGNVVMAKACLRALGLKDPDLNKVEQAWLTQPDTAKFPGNPLRAEFGLTLEQYRGIAKLAQARHVDTVQMASSLWLQTLGEVIQAHAQDPVLDPNQIQNETNARLLKKGIPAL